MKFGSDTIPENWLLCDGSEVSRTTYQDLFNTIGTSFGQGDGFTTFNLPDLRGRVGVGKSNDTEFNELGKTGGEKEHSLTINEMPAHSHMTKVKMNAVGFGDGYLSAASGYDYQLSSSPVENTGGGQPHSILQPYTVANYIIKAFQSSGVVATVVDNLNSTSATDALSAKQGKLLGQYSTNETVVGTWIDGKPIYRKVINFGALPNATAKLITTDLSWATTMVINISGFAIRSSDNNVLPINFTNPLDAREEIGCRLTGTNTINVLTGTDRSNFIGYIILEYTKTTD